MTRPPSVTMFAMLRKIKRSGAAPFTTWLHNRTARALEARGFIRASDNQRGVGMWRTAWVLTDKGHGAAS